MTSRHVLLGLLALACLHPAVSPPMALAVGLVVGLSPHQFGAWAALAIHDTSSVVGAAAAYDAASVPTATILKLTRALWIVPLVVALVAIRRRRDPASGARIAWKKAVPLFIVLFVLASAVRALVPSGEALYDALALAGRRGLVVSLLLVGAGLTRATLRAVGWTPMVQAVVLWLAATGVALGLVVAGWV